MNTISKAISKMLLRHPFYGKLVMSTQLEERHDIPTMATDGAKIYYNPAFVENQLQSRVDWTMFVLAHEVEHIVRMHCLRRGSRDPMLWNMAADHLINLALLNAGFTGPVDDEGRFLGLADNKFDNEAKWSTELVYRELDEDQDDDNDSGQDDGDNDGEGDGEGSDQDDGDSDEGEGSGKGPGAGKTKTPAGADNIFDGDVLEPTNDDGKPLSAQERDELDRVIRGRILNAAAQAKAQHGIGSIPAHLQGVLGDLTKPKVDWRSELREFLVSKTQDDQTWAKLNRRLRPHGIKMPSFESEGAGALAVIIDTSGSVRPYMTLFMSEFVAIVNDVKPESIRVMFIDVRVQAEVTTTPDNLLADMGELLASPPFGGGTDLRPAFNQIEDDFETEYDAVICLTDMMTPWPEHFRYGDQTLFLDVCLGKYADVSFGRLVHMEGDQ